MRVLIVLLSVCALLMSPIIFMNCYASALQVAVADPYVRPGERVNAYIEQTSLDTPSCGYQAFLEYDQAVLSLDPAFINLYSEPYGLLVHRSVVGSEIDVAAGINVFAGQSPTTGSGKLCYFTFDTTSQEGTASIRFRTHLAQTRLTDQEGYPIIPELIDSPLIYVDGTPPVITSKPADITVPNDPGLWTALVNTGLPAASDNLSGVGQITATRSDGLDVSDPYPAGLTTVRWSVADRSGNTTACVQRVVVYVVGILEPVVLNPYVKPGERIYVDLCQFDLMEPVTGYQAFMSYDPTMVGISLADVKVPREPFGLVIWKALSPGTIDIAAGINTFIGQQPTWEDAPVATMAFTAGQAEGITSVDFREHNPPSLFTDLGGYPVYPTLSNSRCIVIDGTPPLLEQPQDILVTASAGATTALVGIPAPAASDPLSGLKSLVGVRGDGLALSDPYPVGATRITWTASDMAGNETIKTHLVVVAPAGFRGVLEKSVAAAKQRSNGTEVALILPVVTASLDDCFYVEDADRVAGIKINRASGVLPLEGHVPVVFGVLATEDGERVIGSASVYAFEEAGLLEPLGINGRALDNPISQGLLVKLCGKAAVESGDGDEFVLLDGSPEGVRVKANGSSLPDDGTFITVTGAVGCDSVSPLLRITGLDNTIQD